MSGRPHLRPRLQCQAVPDRSMAFEIGVGEISALMGIEHAMHMRCEEPPFTKVPSVKTLDEQDREHKEKRCNAGRQLLVEPSRCMACCR